MCGRYRRTTAEDELARRYGVEIPRERDLPISWNIAPAQDILAIRYNPESKQRTQRAGSQQKQWGAKTHSYVRTTASLEVKFFQIWARSGEIVKNMILFCQNVTVSGLFNRKPEPFFESGFHRLAVEPRSREN